MKNLLFVCTANLQRSPTAENVCQEIAKKYNIDITARSAGISLSSPNPVTEELIRWAHHIFVMEEHHKDWITRIDNDAEEKIIVLDIPDIYYRNDPELVSILKDKLNDFILKMR